MTASAIKPGSEDTAPPPMLPSWLRIDPLLLLAALGLVACSLITLKGATANDIPGDPLHFVERQGLYAAGGLVLAIALCTFDYTRLRELRYGIYGLLIAANLLVMAVGSATRGSRRWIELPFFQLQPSELGKVLLIVALAGFAVDAVRRVGDRATTAKIMVATLVPAMLVIAQPDLGTGLVYVVVGLTILFVLGAPWRHFAGLFALFAVAATLVLVAAPAIGVHVLKPYQVERLTGFLNPSKDPRDASYQINQSKIAIGSGEKTGRPSQNATQTRLDFLPEHHTDFIFAVVGERYGFAGAAVVLSLFALLIWRAIRILTMAKNLFGTLIAAGVLAMLMWQVFVNVGMTIGIMPITGVPLPLMSFGGASVITTLMALGLLQSVHIQARIAAGSKAGAYPI